MSDNGQQWTALESKHERLADVSRPVSHAGAPRWGRLPWHRRIAATAGAAGTEGATRAGRHSRRRTGRPEA
jgi:hypothetical protein